MPTTEESEAERNTRTLLDRARTTTDDLYALLGLPSATTTTPHDATSTQQDQQPQPDPPTPAAIKKAYRTAALKAHPDKNPDDKHAATTFDAINKAYEILADPASRAIYDDRQRAAAAKAERARAFDGRRRRMKEELERRESAGRRSSSGVGVGVGDAFGASPGATPAASPAGAAGVKRKFGSPGGASAAPMDERQEAELRRLAAEGARRRAEQQEKLRRQREEAASREVEGDSGAEERLASGANTPPRTFKFSTPTSGKKVGVGVGVGGTPDSGGGAKTPSLFESTMQRLREAEKKRQQSVAGAARTGEPEATPAT